VSQLLLDGAVGTELQRRGIDVDLPAWSARALLDARGRAALAAVHADYARAGADLVTTATFRSTPRSLRAWGAESRWRLLNQRAVDAARAGAAAAPGPRPRVAGSIAPLEDCYRPDLVPPRADATREHLAQADLLARLGVDVLLIETMNTGREAGAAIAAARLVGIDALVSLCPGSGDALLSGERLEAVIPHLLDAGGGRVRGVLLNCAPPEVLAAAAPTLARLAGSLPWGVYAHLGTPDPITGWRLPADQDPEGYADWMTPIVSAGATLVGGCCGTTPDHIRALDRRFRSAGTGAAPTPPRGDAPPRR
jgi:S-methylmethionine-dependent homocysteine/selenocysteine methylase